MVRQELEWPSSAPKKERSAALVPVFCQTTTGSSSPSILFFVRIVIATHEARRISCLSPSLSFSLYADLICSPSYARQIPQESAHPSSTSVSALCFHTPRSVPSSDEKKENQNEGRRKKKLHPVIVVVVVVVIIIIIVRARQSIFPNTRDSMNNSRNRACACWGFHSSQGRGYIRGPAQAAFTPCF